MEHDGTWWNMMEHDGTWWNNFEQGWTWLALSVCFLMALLDDCWRRRRRRKTAYRPAGFAAGKKAKFWAWPCPMAKIGLKNTLSFAGNLNFKLWQHLVAWICLKSADILPNLSQYWFSLPFVPIYGVFKVLGTLNYHRGRQSSQCEWVLWSAFCRSTPTFASLGLSGRNFV